MMLTRLFLNPVQRDVQRCLSDAQELHRRVLSLFVLPEAGSPRAALGVLHRLEVSEREGLIALLVQSREPADASRLPELFLDPRLGADACCSTSLTHLLDSIDEGKRFRFRLRGNPTRRILTKSGPDGKRQHGKRVPLHGDEARQTWLSRKLLAIGLAVLEGTTVLQRPDGRSVARRRSGIATHEGYTFEGLVQVLDPKAARLGIERGIGPARAYGFGLLSLAPMGEG